MNGSAWMAGMAAGLAGFAATTASAAVLSISSVTGVWESPVGGAGVQQAGSTITWGDDRRSGYAFDAGTADFGPHEEGQQFALGSFVHNNRPIPIGSGIQSANLRVTFNAILSSAGIQEQVTLSSLFSFDHFETHNQAVPCANGESNGSGLNVNGCADRVTASNNPGASASGRIGDRDYQIDISGFQIAGAPMNAFWTVENATNTAQLLGTFRLSPVPIPGGETPTPIPLPAASWLLLSALGGMAVALRRRKTAG